MNDPNRKKIHPDCPSADALSSFLLGRLSEDALETMAAHLETCSRCMARLDRLHDTADDMVDQLRKTDPDSCSAAESAHAASLVEPLADRVPPPPSRPSGVSMRALGQYDLLEKLGEGGMGVVYRARHRLMEQVVAVKVLHAERLGSPAAVERFRREIRALARLNHPNIVRAQYADEAAGSHFLVMEHITGSDLADVLRRRGPLPVGMACAIAVQVAGALQHAHENGLVHRDLKPSNLMLTPDGQVKVLDLGLALVCEGPTGEGLTSSGQVMGTYDYMAPEQWDDVRTVDVRADLYSLGCVLCFLLTGDPPFGGGKSTRPTVKMKAHATQPPPPVRQRRPDVPAALDAVIQRLLAKRPSQRYATPAEAAAALEPFATSAGPGSSETVRLLSDFAARRWRRQLLTWALPTAAVGAALVLLALLWGPSHSLTSRRGTEVVTPTTSPARPLTSGQPDDRPVEIATFRVDHFRGNNPPADYGEVGRVPALERDGLRAHVELKEPAYCYLIAFNTNGTEQLLWPAEPDDAPERTEALTFPRGPLETFDLTDGPGLQALALVASREPLPSYRRWQAQVGLAPWKRLRSEQAWGTWRCDGRRTQAQSFVRGSVNLRQGVAQAICLQSLAPAAGLGGLPWAGCWLATADGPVRIVTNLGKFLRQRPGVAAVSVVAFPVRPATR